MAALLPVLDTLEMAANAQTADENYKKGVQMTLEKAAGVFAGLKVAEIEAQGKEFDPNLMNAVMQQPAPEGTQAGTVLQVLQKGYTYGGQGDPPRGRGGGRIEPRFQDRPHRKFRFIKKSKMQRGE